MSSKLLNSRPSKELSQRLTGVVIWTDSARELAVIWCTDHDRLAYLTGRTNLRVETNWPQPGDLVGFDMDQEGELRHCTDLHVIQKDWHPELAEALRNVSDSCHHDQSTPKDERPVDFLTQRARLRVI